MDGSIGWYLSTERAEQVARSAHVPSPAVMRANLLCMWDMLTQDERIEAVSWYPRARYDLQSISNATGCPYSHVCALTAAGSFAFQWERQRDLIQMQVEYLQCFQDWQGIPGCPLTGHQKRTMRLAYLYGPSVLHSPKWSDFCQTLLGDRDCVCIDKHTYVILRGVYTQYKKVNLTLPIYKYMQATLYATAQYLGIRAEVLGAAAWGFARLHTTDVTVMLQRALTASHAWQTLSPDGNADYIG